MGLLNLFLQNKTTLDVDPTPKQGNGPVGTPTGEFNTGVTQFQQVWDSTNTYVNSFEGGTNTGIQPPTLKETGLDIDNPNYIPSTTTPNTLTLYPATAKGGLGQSALQFLQIWTPVINYNDIVVGAPTSPLRQSLPETGLDNTDLSSVPTTVSPNNTTDYPSLAKGEYNSVSTQYTQIYGPNKTYLNNYDPNVQPNSLDETGLDVENIGLISTTAAPSPDTSYPSLASGEFGGQSDNFNQSYTPTSTYLNTFNPNVQPNTIIQGQTGLDNINPAYTPTTVTPFNPTNYPNQSTGEFGGASTQYTSPYGPNNTYEDAYVNSPINFDTLQPVTLDETGLDNSNPFFSPTTELPIDTTVYPQYTQGEFNGVPTLYNQMWGPGFGYLANYNPNVQPSTLGQTGLDNTNTSFAPTTTTPDTPNIYPQFVQGEFGSAPSQYFQVWGPNNNYFNLYNPTLGNTIQIVTLGQTGLDTNNPNFTPTTTTPSTTTQYPSLASGEFGGSSTQYSQTYNSNNTYLNNVPVEDPNSPQLNTLSQTGLDIEDSNAVPTTTTPDTVTVYPSLTSGEFSTAAGQYNQNYNSNNTYLESNFTNAQEGTLDLTGLDNTDTNELPTTFVPDSVSTPTIYPQPAQTYLGEFQGAPSQFDPQYSPLPGQSYLDNYNTITNDADNIQVNTLDQTRLDIDSLLPPDPTVYPVLVTGELGEAPSLYSQTFTPANQYYNFMKVNYQAH